MSENAPSVEFNPQPIDVLKKRARKAIARVYTEADVDSGDVPGKNPDCVFDYENGCRMILSMERQGAEVVTHVSFSFNGSPKEFASWIAGYTASTNMQERVAAVFDAMYTMTLDLLQTKETPKIIDKFIHGDKMIPHLILPGIK